MSIDNPTVLNMGAIALVGKEDGCNLAAANTTEKKLCPAVPTGKTFIPDFVVMDEFDGALGEAVVSFGVYDGNCNEFTGGNITLTNIGAGYATDCLIVRPVPSATPVASCILVAGEFFAMEIQTKEDAAATCRIKVFGHFDDA